MKKILITIIILAAIGTAGYFTYTKWIMQSDKNSVSEKANPEIEFYHCSMHPQVVSDKPGKCPICKMDLTPVYKQHGTKQDGIVQIDPTMVQNIGVKTETVMKRKLTHTIRATGRIDYDETKQTIITTKFSGYIEKLFVDYTGKPVQQGQPLFEIYSPELVAAQQEYLQAKHYSAAMKSSNDNITSNSANDLLQSAKKKLIYWDISSAQINQLEQTGEIKKTLIIYSPFSGVVMEKNIFDGMQIQAGMSLLKLVDVSQMWIYADVYENDLSWIKVGENVMIELPNDAGKTLKGNVSFIYPFLQEQSRTAKVRIDFPNENKSLKKDMYVTVNIMPTDTMNAIVVPEQSVIHSGSRNVIVLSLGEGKFKSVDVKLGALADGFYQVLSGLVEGDTIVTSSQFLIDSESNLKAGTSFMQGMDMSGMKMNDENQKPNNDMQNMSDSAMQNMKMK